MAEDGFDEMPSRFGPYEVFSRVGGDAQMQRYLARRDAARVLLMQLPAPGESDLRFLRTTLDEASLLKILRHPNIARLDDVGELGGIAYVAYEYVHGGNLRSLRAQGPIDLGAAIGLAIQACAGLHDAHERVHHGHPLHIAHRDLRPTSVLVSYVGEVKIGAFGLSRIANPAARRDALEDPRPYVYMSREQLRGERDDRRVDVYALGTLLYELTTGVPAFDAPTAIEVFRAIDDGRFSPPSHRISGYPPALERVVLRAMARDREERYPTAADLQHALGEVARERGLDISPSHLADVVSARIPR